MVSCFPSLSAILESLFGRNTKTDGKAENDVRRKDLIIETCRDSFLNVHEGVDVSGKRDRQPGSPD